MPMRVYELSKKLGMTNKELLALLKDHGYSLTGIAVVPPEAQALAEKQKSSPAQAAAPEKKPVKKDAPAPVKTTKKATAKQPVRKQAVAPAASKDTAPKKKKPAGQKSSPVAPSKKIIIHHEEKEALAPGTIYAEAVTVGDFATAAAVPVSEVILALLKKGIAAPVTQLLPVETVRELAQGFEVTVVERTEQEDGQEAPAVAEDVQGDWQTRMPVIVVIGHVDHGKTTLLDHVRSTRVAAKEKGGITQHLGAYEVDTKQGALVFLDTPGHEAFSLMRVRGIKVADIAILMIAADDGIKPQTEEAISAAKIADIPLVVAINKVDKASQAQIDAVMNQLAQYELLPEDWGGQTVVVPISAKSGKGVDDLLEVIDLQAQLMELKANLTVPARGYVLESKIEKGRGPVATVICHHGVLRTGDYFLAGNVTGRVSSMVDSEGNAVKQAGPSVPVQVAGFDSLPQAGDVFEVHPQKVVKKGVQAAQARADLLLRKAGEARTGDIDIILKADNASSREAVTGALERLSQEHGSISIIHSGIGDISESDATFAADTGALIFGLHVRVQPNASEVIQKKGLTVKTYDIIYKLIEDLEERLEKGKPIKTELKKIGDATVLKTFDVKNLGVIAGSIVNSGRFSKTGTVKVYRGKELIGQGTIKSLQRERKTVKEVHAGFECGFLIDGFNDFEVDDRVECYEEMPVQ